MNVKYIGETAPLELTNGNIYSVLSIEKGWYRVIDDTGEDYLYPPDVFQVVDDPDGQTKDLKLSKAERDRLRDDLKKG